MTANKFRIRISLGVLSTDTTTLDGYSVNDRIPDGVLVVPIGCLRD